MCLYFSLANFASVLALSACAGCKTPKPCSAGHCLSLVEQRDCLAQRPKDGADIMFCTKVFFIMCSTEITFFWGIIAQSS